MHALLEPYRAYFNEDDIWAAEATTDYGPEVTDVKTIIVRLERAAIALDEFVYGGGGSTSVKLYNLADKLRKLTNTN